MDEFERAKNFTEEEELLLLTRTPQRRKLQRFRSVVTTASIAILLILPWTSYYFGYQVGRSSRPRLPTEGIDYGLSTTAFEYTTNGMNSDYSGRGDVPIEIT